MLTPDIVGRLIVGTHPHLASDAWMAWSIQATLLRGEDYEVAAMLRLLLDVGATSRNELVDLGATQRQLDLTVLDDEPTSNKVPATGVVFRRHAEPGALNGLSESGVRAASSLASLTAVDKAMCSPVIRATTTARAWSDDPVIEPVLALPPTSIEDTVGVHASFHAWRTSTDAAVKAYCGRMAEVARDALDDSRSTLIITHDGVIQAATAGLGVAPQTFRNDALSHLEGVMVRVDSTHGYTADRLGAPPMVLLEE